MLNSLLALGGSGLWFLILTGFGKKFLNLFKIKLQGLEKLLLSFALGFGVVSLLIYFLGQLRLYYLPILIVFSILAFLIGLPGIIEIFQDLKGRRLSKPKQLNDLVLIIIGLIFFLVVLVGALAPEIEFDGIWYHLTEVKFYLKEHHLLFFPAPSQLAQSTVVPRLMEMQFLPLLAFFKTETLAKLAHFWLWPLSGLVAYIFGSYFYNKKVGLVAFLITIIIPPNFWLARTAYIDLGSLFFGGITFFSLWRYFETRQKPWFYLSAVFLGFLFSVKTFNLFIVLPSLSLVWFFLKGWKSYKEQLIYFVIGLLILLPWLIEAFIYTKNPFFPVFSLWDASHLGKNFNPREWLFIIHSKIFLKNFWQAFTAFTPFLIFIPPLFLFPKYLKKAGGLLALGGLLVFFWTFIPNVDMRFVVLSFVPLSLIAAYSIVSLENISRVLSGVLKLTLVLITLVYLNFAWQQNRDFVAVALGRESRENFLIRYFQDNIWTFYDGGGKFKEKLGKNAKVIALVHNMFYIDFPYEDGLNLNALLGEGAYQNEKTFLKALEDKGFTHLLVKTATYQVKDILQGPDQSDLGKNFDKDWLFSHFTPILEEKGTVLYEIRY